MAAKDSENGAAKKQEELEEMSTCCICTDVYTDPRALPCIHTFCMKCLQETGLKTNKGPGDEMPCPYCRQMFKIPQDGFRGLPKNFFIANLIKVTNVLDQSATPRSPCDACLEENKEGTGKEIPAADTYCADCNQNFCKECCRQHTKFKLSKNHKMTPITDHVGAKDVKIDQVPSAYELIEQKGPDVYCVDCKTVVGAMCFIDEHKNHEGGSHVDEFVGGFRKQIEDTAADINACRSQAETKKAELLKIMEDVKENVKNLECDVEKRKGELKQFADIHATSLLRGLCSTRQIKLKEIQSVIEDVDTCLSSMETYNSYCHNKLDNGSASDICRAFSELSVRAMKLQEQCKPIVEREIQSFNFCFTKSELEEILGESCVNWIGEIEEEGYEKPKKRIKQSLLIKENKELKQQLEAKKLEITKLEITTQGTNSRLAEQNNETDLLRKENNELKQQLETTKLEIAKRRTSELRYISDPVFVQTVRTMAAQEENEPIFGLALLDKELFAVSANTSDVEVFDSMKLVLSRRMNLKELIYPLDIVACTKNKCLYIFDSKGQPSKILRIDPNGRIIKTWPTGSDWGRMSVTFESNIIFIDSRQNRLNEYSADGQLIRHIQLSSNTGFKTTWHAIKLTNGNFVVSHGLHDDELHRLCIIDKDGKIKKSYGASSGSDVGRINLPSYLLVDGNGLLMVVDQVNNRVLLFDLDLNFKRAILSKGKHGLRRPSRIALDESNGRLFATDNKYESWSGYHIDGRILIADFN